MAGFPNAAEEAGTLPMDINQMVVKRPASTFYMRVDGDSMVQTGIHSGDIVVIDKSLPVLSGDLVVVFIEGEFTIRQFRRKGPKTYLISGYRGATPEEIGEGSNLEIWGVITYTIHQRRGNI